MSQVKLKNAIGIKKIDNDEHGVDEITAVLKKHYLMEGEINFVKFKKQINQKTIKTILSN